MPIRVAFDARDARDPQRRGWGRHAADLLDALARRDDVDVRAWTGGGRLPELVWEQVGWPARLLDDPPDVVHAPNCFLPLVRPAPGVVTVHDLAFEVHPHDFSPRTGWKYRTFTRRAVRSAEAVVCVSRATADDVCERYAVDPGRVHVVANAPSLRGVPVAPDDHSEAVPPSVRGDRPTPDAPSAPGHPDAPGTPARPTSSGATASRPDEERPYLLAIGDLRAKKNLPRLVRAWRASGLAHRLVLVGTPTATAQVAELEAAGTEVRGWVPEAELDRLLRGAAALVHPSLFEGFGLVLLEAMERGVPVACSAIPSLVETAGAAAVTFDPRDEDDLARALHEVLRRRDELVSAGRRRASTFGWDRAAAETVDVYRLIAR